MTAIQLLPSLQKRDAFVVPQVTWEQYEAIDHAFSTIPGLKFRYLDRQLELMTVSPEHEEFKRYVTYADQDDAVREFRQSPQPSQNGAN